MQAGESLSLSLSTIKSDSPPWHVYIKKQTERTARWRIDDRINPQLDDSVRVGCEKEKEREREKGKTGREKTYKYVPGRVVILIQSRIIPELAGSRAQTLDCLNRGERLYIA